MKISKRIIFVFFVGIFTFFFGCTKAADETPLSKNQPYIFEKSVCTVYDGVTMENLSKYIPIIMPHGQKTPETVEEFEAMVLTNIRTFSIHYMLDGETIEVYFRNVLASIEITDTICKIQGEETLEFPYKNEGNTYTITVEQETVAFTYEDGRLSYTIKAPEYFEVTHYFKLAE